MSGEDSSLVAQIMIGDEAALAVLYDRYASILQAMLLRILNDSGAAEEVLQDVFLQLWCRAGRFDSSRGTLAAWLFVMGRSRALSRLRARGRREALESFEPDVFTNTASFHDPEGEVMRMQLSERLREAMSTLPVKQREALELAYFQGMSHTEIAAWTGSPPGTVKSRVRSGILALRALFVS